MLELKPRSIKKKYLGNLGGGHQKENIGFRQASY